MKKLVSILSVTSLVVAILLGLLCVIGYNNYKKESEKYASSIPLMKESVASLKKNYEAIASSSADETSKKEVQESIATAEKALTQAEGMTPGKFNACMLLALLGVVLAIATIVSVFLKNPSIALVAGGLLILVTIIIWVIVPSFDPGKYGGLAPQKAALLQLIPSVIGGALAIVRKRMA